jgi:hypothetical protein
MTGRPPGGGVAATTPIFGILAGRLLARPPLARSRCVIPGHPCLCIDPGRRAGISSRSVYGVAYALINLEGALVASGLALTTVSL